MRIQKWAAVGVKGHFQGELPWGQCEDVLPPLLQEVVGAADPPELEVAGSNSLTVNLHMLMAAFYRPTPTRNDEQGQEERGKGVGGGGEGVGTGVE